MLVLRLQRQIKLTNLSFVHYLLRDKFRWGQQPVLQELRNWRKPEIISIHFF